MLLSVFTPAHRTQWLDRLYISLRDQTVAEWEWVVCPNGPHAGAIVKILQGFGDNRVVIHPAPPGPPNVGRLKRFACEQARGELLVEVDSDDWLALHALAAIRKTYEETSAGFIFSECVCPTEDGGVDVYSKKYGWEYDKHTYDGKTYLVMRNFDISPRSLSEVYFAPNHVRVWSADAYWAAGGHDPALRIADDQDLIARTYLTGTPFAAIKEVLYYQPRHAEATSIRLVKEIAATQSQVRDKYLHRLIFEWCRREGLPMIDLGGEHNSAAGFKTLDKVNISGKVDYVADVRDMDKIFQDSSVGCFRAFDFLEHIPIGDVVPVMNSVYRKLVDGGWFITGTPSVCDDKGLVGRGAFQDPSHCCHSEDTEVFTTDGFKLFSALDGNERFYVFNVRENKAEELPALKTHVYDYQGKMVHFSGRHFNCLVTPNHNMVVGSSDESTAFRFLPASDCRNFKSPARVPSMPVFDGDHPEYFEIPGTKLKLHSNPDDGFVNDTVRLPIEPFVEFMGWWLSEGATSTKDDAGGGNFYRISVFQSENANPDKYERIGVCLRELGYKPFRNANGWHFNDKHLAIWLRQFGRSPQRFIHARLKALHPVLLRKLLDSLMLGDGTRQGRNSWAYGTTSDRLASDVQEIALKCGFRANWSKEKRIGKLCTVNPDYRCKHDMNLVYVSKSRHQYLPRSIEEVDYSGKVYCVTVPEHHVIMTRRAGKCAWSGNSFWSTNNFMYYTDKNLAKYVPDIACRFQDVRVFTAYPSEHHRKMFIPYVYADLMALKGKRHPGLSKI